MKMEPTVSSETSAIRTQTQLPMKMEPTVSSEKSAIRTQTHLPMKMEPTVSSETSAIRTQTPGNYPKRNKLHPLLSVKYLFTEMSLTVSNVRSMWWEIPVHDNRRQKYQIVNMKSRVTLNIPPSVINDLLRVPHY